MVGLLLGAASIAVLGGLEALVEAARSGQKGIRSWRSLPGAWSRRQAGVLKGAGSH
jgi:hypothetical protein